MKRNFLISFILIVLCGCGYTAGSFVSSKGHSVYVENFVNEINVTQEISDRKPYYAYKPAMEADITRSIIDKFLYDGNYEIKDQESAEFVLKGQLVDYRREPLRYDANDYVIEYRLSVVVNMELFDRISGKKVWQEKNFAGESTYRTTGQYAKSENTTLDEALEDLSNRVVERTVENW